MATLETAWPFKRYIMVVWACLECLLLAGLTFGWYSLVYVLQKERFFLDYCEDPYHLNDTSSQEDHYNVTYNLYSKDTSHSSYGVARDETDYNVTGTSLLNVSSTVSMDDRCVKQDEMFALVFTVASSLLTLFTPVLGHLQYKLGTRLVRVVITIIFLIGSLCLAFMTVDTPWLSFVGLTLIGIAGIPILTTNIQIANLFTTGASTAVCFMTGSFDASTSMQVLVKIGFENGVSRKTSYLIVSGLTSMLVISTFFFLPKGFIEKSQDDNPMPVEMYSYERTEGDDDNNDDNDETKINNKLLKLNGDGNQGRKPKPVMKSSAIPSLKQCLLSRMFITHTIWLALLQLRFLYYLGTLNPRLNSLTEDGEGVSYYTNMCQYIQFGSLLTGPLTGALMDFEKRRFSKRPSAVERELLPTVFPLILASVVGMVICGLAMVPSEDVLIPTFVLATAYRSLMYGIGLGFLRRIFPVEYMALMYGLMMVAGGIINTLQYPLFIWIGTPPVGSTKVEGLLMALVVLTLIHPAYLCWASHQTGKGFHTQETSIIEAGSSDLAQPFRESQDSE